MNAKVLIFFLLPFIQTNSDQNNEKELSKEYIAKCEAVFTALIKERTEDKTFIAYALKVYKGNIGRVTYFDGRLTDFQFKPDVQYLIYAHEKSKDSEVFYVSKMSRTGFLTMAEKDIQYLENNVQCIDKSLIKDGACIRGPYYPHCGCDGNLYGSACDAHKQGVAVYSLGGCSPDSRK